eukprot:2920361-Rhodomonas_salina.1
MAPRALQQEERAVAARASRRWWPCIDGAGASSDGRAVARIAVEGGASSGGKGFTLGASGGGASGGGKD